MVVARAGIVAAQQRLRQGCQQGGLQLAPRLMTTSPGFVHYGRSWQGLQAHCLQLDQGQSALADASLQRRRRKGDRDLGEKGLRSQGSCLY